VRRSIAGERNLRAVGRPSRPAVHAPRLDERRLAEIDFRRRSDSRHARAIDLSFLHVEDELAVGRDFRILTFGDAPRRTRHRGARRPDRAIRAVRVAVRIRDPARVVRGMTSHEHNRAPVVRHLHLREVDAVVFQEGRDTHGLERRSRGRKDVALAFLIGNPGDAIRLPGRDELERKSGLQDRSDARNALRFRSLVSNYRRGQKEHRHHSGDQAKSMNFHLSPPWRTDITAGPRVRRSHCVLGACSPRDVGAVARQVGLETLLASSSISH